jgi:hypothetical protein
MESVSVSTNSNSASAFDRSFGTESQPLMFHYIEGQKWNKLRKMLNRKTCKEMCSERDDSGLSLLGMALGFEAPLDIIKTILVTDPSQAHIIDCFGATPLHVACLNGASPEAVLYLLNHYSHLAKARDRDNRLPLHHAVECLCRDEIEFNEGAQVINYLIEVFPDAIHASDKHHDSPIDLVQLARMKSTIDSKEFKRLSNLYVMLRDIGIRVYKNRKLQWESAGYDATCTKVNSCDTKSRSTVSTKDSSVGSSFNTHRETFEGMKLSDFDSDKNEYNSENRVAAGPSSAASYEEGSSTINSESPKKTKKIRLKFWKK